MAAELHLRPVAVKSFAIAFALVLSGAAGLGSAGAGEPYRLGVALGFTGTGALYSQDALRGIEIAVEEVNAAGGLLGQHPIELFIANTRTRPDVAARVVTDLIDKSNVRAVIGTYSSAAAIAIKPICRAKGVLHIATVSNSEDITRLDFSPYTFSVVPNTYMMSKAVAVGIAKLADKNGWTRYVTIASDYAWGRSNQENQVAQLARLAPGVTLAQAYWPPLGQKTFNSFIVAIRQDKPDFVLASIAGEDNEYWLRDAWDYGLNRELAIPGSLISVTELLRDAKWIRRGIYGRTRAPFFTHLDVPMMAAFVEKYRAKFERYPSDWSVMSYDGMQALRQGVESAGSIDSDRVKDALKGLTIDTTRGRLFFREVDNQLSASAYFGRIGDDPRYPFPIYTELLEMPGPDIWRPEAEILAARASQ